MWIILLVASVCIGLFPCLHASDDKEIKVYLSTSSNATPLYVGDWQVTQTTLDPSYLDKVKEILEIDLTRDGYSTLLTHNEDKERQLEKLNRQEAYTPKIWKSWGVAHVIAGIVDGHTLSLQVFSVHTCILRHLPRVELTGSLNSDRRRIHQLCDILQKVLYNVEGIANARILYCMQLPATANAGKWTSEIWECDLDGANARQVTHEGSYCVTPIFLPSRNRQDRFIYVSYKQGQPKLYIATVKDGLGKKLVHLRGNQLLPAVSPQRDQLAFICDASGRTDLFVQRMDPASGCAQKPVQLYSFPRSTQASPTFSPDGSKIAFVSDKDGSAKIYVIPTSAANGRPVPQLITKKNMENTCPAWSPDGTKIAYSAKTKDVRQIWIYECATEQEWQLTDGETHKENPQWAPNSLHLVFNSVAGESSELYLANVRQSTAVKITRGPGKKGYPTWGKR